MQAIDSKAEGPIAVLLVERKGGAGVTVGDAPWMFNDAQLCAMMLKDRT